MSDVQRTPLAEEWCVEVAAKKADFGMPANPAQEVRVIRNGSYLRVEAGTIGKPQMGIREGMSLAEAEALLCALKHAVADCKEAGVSKFHPRGEATSANPLDRTERWA